MVFDTPDVSKQRDYLAASGFALVAGGVPFVESERHRLIASVYGGIGKDLDRFSTFRLPGRPTGYEWESLALPMLQGVAFNELYPRTYGIAHLDYRYEALFFMYPYIRASYGRVDYARFQPNGSIYYTRESMPVLGGGLITGAPWNSQIEINYSYNFGIFRDHRGGPPEPGGQGFFVFWAREFEK